MSDHIRFIMIRNGVIIDKIRVASIGDKMSHARVRWFDHIKRKSMDAPMRILKGFFFQSIKWAKVDLGRVETK